MIDLLLLLRLFFEFFKTGLFSIGGGLATLPFLSEMSERTGWFSKLELADMVAVAESTPGPIGINTATYVGFNVAGVPGGIIATLGLVAPSIIVILIICFFLNKFKESRFVKYSFYFLRPISIALICAAGFSLAQTAYFSNEGPVSLQTLSIPAMIMGLVLFILTQFLKPAKKIHPIVWIGISAVCGVLFL